MNEKEVNLTTRSMQNNVTISGLAGDSKEEICRDTVLKFLQDVMNIPIPGADPGFPVGGAPTLVGGGANPRHRHFSVKTYVKRKEFGPVGGGGGARRKLLYVDPPLDTTLRNLGSTQAWTSKCKSRRK